VNRVTKSVLSEIAVVLVFSDCEGSSFKSCCFRK